MNPFKDNFTWGAAASSYQIEGAWREDGKGPSIWDMIAHQPGRIYENSNGDVACDHYHRYREDVALMKEIGLQAYRLSVSWPRVIPTGRGPVNEAGLAFYDRLVDELLSHGIEPWVTLYHWDLPYDLFLRGGWLNPDSSEWMAEYTAAVVERLSDRVTRWITINEPQCMIGLGYLKANCTHAPNMEVGMREALLAAHHVLMAHGRSVQAIRAHAKKPPVVGLSLVGCASSPLTESPEDIEAARNATHYVDGTQLWNHTWWGDPVVFGHYPEVGLKSYAKDLPEFKSSDFDTIRQPIDFMGMNVYWGGNTKAGVDGGSEWVPFPKGQPHTHFNWPISPEILYWAPKFYAEHYKLPIVITENGLSSCDSVALDGRVHDAGRIDFLHRYLLALRRAVADGVDVRGYFHWSVMDNFEWAEGYKHRFGLIHVDYETQQRTLKDSAYWYRDLIRSNGACLALPQQP